ncbi:hypothetical protein HX829_00005, partial [Pseudomonas gingeri]|nr:hypothetical protein [Pseudomonas gingeri]
MKIFTPLPGEYVASALQRGNEILGIKAVSCHDFRIKPIPRKGYGRTGLGEKSEYRAHGEFQFPSFFSKANITDEILNNHTLHPLNAALGRSTMSTITTPALWGKICRDCVFEDFNNHGTAYIHRSHVHTSVKVCSIHGSILLHTCPTCSTPISKHNITKLGFCSQKYNGSTSLSISTNHLYSVFIADLLNYKGPTIKPHEAEWVAARSFYLNYSKEIELDEDFLAKIVKRTLDAHNVTSTRGKLSDSSLAMKAFLGCETAERYLDLVTNEASSKLLEKEVNELRHSESPLVS